MIVKRSLNAMAIFNNQLHSSMLSLTVKALPSMVILLISTASWNAIPKVQGEDAPVWQSLETNGKPHARHEAAFIQVKQRFYLLGGRGIKPVDVLDPATGVWTTGARPPLEIHHFQPVVWQNRILIAGAMTGPYPHETSMERILIYDPEVDAWSWGARIPNERRRGGAGASIYKGKLYLACGIQNGHWDGWVNWLDTYDLRTGKWNILPDAPRVRDHFQISFIGDQLYAAGGRKTSGIDKQVFNLTISEVDVFNTATRKWSTLPSPEGDLPTPRAGCFNYVFNSTLLVAGGESTTQKAAHNEVEAFDPETQTWHLASKLKQGRHGTGITMWQNKIYSCAGCAQRGGSPELNTTEYLPVKTR